MLFVPAALVPTSILKWNRLATSALNVVNRIQLPNVRWKSKNRGTGVYD